MESFEEFKKNRKKATPEQMEDAVFKVCKFFTSILLTEDVTGETIPENIHKVMDDFMAAAPDISECICMMSSQLELEKKEDEQKNNNEDNKGENT